MRLTTKNIQYRYIQKMCLYHLYQPNQDLNNEILFFKINFSFRIIKNVIE